MSLSTATAANPPLILSLEFILSIAEGKDMSSAPSNNPESDSFPLFLIFWAPFSLVLDITLETNPPSQAQQPNR